MAEITSRTGFDWRRFGMALRAEIQRANLPLREIADAIGVTTTDLSRASSGTNVGIEKVFAMADWMERNERDFYVPPMKSDSCTLHPVKHLSVKP